MENLKFNNRESIVLYKLNKSKILRTSYINIYIRKSVIQFDFGLKNQGWLVIKETFTNNKRFKIRTHK